MAGLHGAFRRARAAAAALAVLAAGGAGLGASPGGGYHPATGPGRIAVKGRGAPRPEFFANFRFDFDGVPADASGSGSVAAYDAPGSLVVGGFPFTWTASRGARFRIGFGGAGAEAFLADRIAEHAGQEAAVALERAEGKGTLRPAGEGLELRAVLKATGTVAIGDDPPRRFRARIVLR